jgi:hypothetical protein
VGGDLTLHEPDPAGEDFIGGVLIHQMDFIQDVETHFLNHLPDLPFTRDCVPLVRSGDDDVALSNCLQICWLEWVSMGVKEQLNLATVVLEVSVPLLVS